MTLTLFENHTIMPHPIDDVFALTVNLEEAPRWHSIFTNVQQLTPDPIGIGSRWQIKFGLGSFSLEIIKYEPPYRVAFRGSGILGIVPNFTIELKAVPEGTSVRYLLHPDIPKLMRPIMKFIAPPYGNRDLARYFRELNAALASL